MKFATLLLQVVQGYKFNIFYPDLIEKLEAPTYSLEKDPGADEAGGTCMLRYAIRTFSATKTVDLPALCC